MSSLLVPPASVRGMTSLDRIAFTTVVKVPSLNLCNIIISVVTPIVKKYLLKMPHIKPIQLIDNKIIVYLDPSKVKVIEDITEMDRKTLSIRQEHFQLTELKIKYDNWRPDVILRSVLPEGIEIPTSYSIVGHIVHLNLRDVHLPYKNLIGQVYLDNVSNARTVVNKINTIDTTFRQFTMEILAGDKDTVTRVKENGYTYEFDFAQVYWNPRLSTEHLRLLTFMKSGDTLYDVFAGVGPFAVPAARKNIKTYANDLNPESYYWLQKNAKINKAEKNLNVFNRDGRDFLKNIVKPDILNRRNKDAHGFEHIAMNLPASAIEFLDILPNWFDEDEIKLVCRNPPTMHLYCFVKCQDKEKESRSSAKVMVEEKIGCTLSKDTLIDLHCVRNVAPNKNMIRVSFLLTESVLKGEEPAKKRVKIGNDISEDNTITGKDGEEKIRWESEERCKKQDEEQNTKECIQSRHGTK